MCDNNNVRLLYYHGYYWVISSFPGVFHRDNLKKKYVGYILCFRNFNNPYKFKNVTVAKGVDELDGL